MQYTDFNGYKISQITLGTVQLGLKYMRPYEDYCGHCAILYSRVFKRYGIEAHDCDYSQVDDCKCVEHYRTVRNQNDKMKF